MKWFLPLLTLLPILFISISGAEDHVDADLCNELKQTFNEAVKDGTISHAEAKRYIRRCYNHAHK